MLETIQNSVAITRKKLEVPAFEKLTVCNARGNVVFNITFPYSYFI